MTYQPMTPFRRAVDAAVIQHQSYSDASDGPERINKWEVLRELAVARASFGLSDRELGVLRALLSFHPSDDLVWIEGGLVVFPSNASLCERLNGMPCSTMRRHLAALVRAGVLLRRDSPNGKRYRQRGAGEREAFGFDLSPLVARFAEICAAAEDTRAAEEAWSRARQTVSVMRRDLAGLAAYGADIRPNLTVWDRFDDMARLTAQALRRQLALDDLQQLHSDLEVALDEIRTLLDVPDHTITENMSTSDAKSDQHQQNSNKDTYDFEPCLEKQTGEGADQSGDVLEERGELPNIPLGLVVSCCPELAGYVGDPIKHWHHLVRAAEIVRPMMGISTSAWTEAVEAMGPEQAAVVVAAMLERFSEIKSPGGYLRHLTRRAGEGAFSCGPMVMALMRRAA